jgi:5-methylthioadenosine/S-adenosylhomocysteine deaminase
MGTLLVRDADWVITMDPDRRIVRGGAIAIRDDRIAAVGPTAEVARGFTADRTIDAAGKLAMPGLIDTHVHNTQQLGRGLADECDIAKHLLERLYGYERVLTSDDAYLAARACQLELIRAGTTCFIDPGSYYPEETARALGESGLRGIVARTAFDVYDTPIGPLPTGMFRQTTAEAVERAQQIVTNLNGTHGGRLKAWFALRILSGCSDELCRQVAARAQANRVGVVLHCAESRDEVVGSRMRYGRGEVERLHALGVLGPNMVLIHMGWTNPRELVLCKEFDLKVSCTPSAGFRLDPTVMPPERVLEMATLHGARAAMWEREIGSLEVGKKADLVLFDTRRPEWRPVLNPIANLVYASRGGADTVLVDGRVLMEAGVVKTLDEAAILADVQRRGEAIAAASGLGEVSKPAWPIV